MKNKLIMFLSFILNPRLLFCVGIAWMITNGWSYVMFAVGSLLNIDWMIAVGGAYLAFLWLPVSPEKIVTVAIAMGLMRYLYPNDEKTLGVLISVRVFLIKKLGARPAPRKILGKLNINCNTYIDPSNV